MDPLTLLAAFGPLMLEAGKAVIGKFIGSDFKPATIQDWLTMQQADTARFTAINAAAGSNPSYPWVEAIIRLQRPIVAGAALLTWAYTHSYGTTSDSVDNFTAVIGFYLFGDRTLFHISKAKP